MPLAAGADAALELEGAAAGPDSHAAHVKASAAATGTLSAAMLTRAMWRADRGLRGAGRSGGSPPWASTMRRVAVFPAWIRGRRVTRQG